MKMFVMQKDWIGIMAKIFKTKQGVKVYVTNEWYNKSFEKNNARNNAWLKKTGNKNNEVNF